MIRTYADGRPEAQPVAGEHLAVIADSTTTSGYTYWGTAKVGTATSAASWRIARTKDDFTEQDKYADGNDDMDNVWDDRASLIYS